MRKLTVSTETKKTATTSLISAAVAAFVAVPLALTFSHSTPQANALSPTGNTQTATSGICSAGTGSSSGVLGAATEATGSLMPGMGGGTVLASSSTTGGGSNSSSNSSTSSTNTTSNSTSSSSTNTGNAGNTGVVNVPVNVSGNNIADSNTVLSNDTVSALNGNTVNALNGSVNNDTVTTTVTALTDGGLVKNAGAVITSTGTDLL